jgi:glutamyl/glutaminyl-tRNA synthetase
MPDFALRSRPFLSDEVAFEPEAVEKYLRDERLGDLLAKLADDFAGLEDFSAGRIEETLRARAEAEGIAAGLLIHATRVLVLGTKVSPGIFDVLELVGRGRTVARLRKWGDIKGRGNGDYPH